MNKIIITLILFVTSFAKAQTYTIDQGGSISTCSGTIYDSGGSGAGYSNGENYTTTFCSSSGNCLSVTINAFSLGGINGDRLILYDGPTTAYAVIANINGGQTPAGTTYTSTSGCITIRFRSDASTTGAGFQLTIGCSACPTQPSYNNPNGFIYTCNALFYDFNGPTTNYGNDQNRTTKFCSSDGSCVRVSFGSFSTDMSRKMSTLDCCVRVSFGSFSTESGYDILSIYDGNSTSATQIGSGYSGTNSPGIVTSSSGCLTFNFTSDGDIRAAGWQATVSCVPCPTPPPPEQQNCDGARLVCADLTVPGNSSGSGSVLDLNSSNDGCLSGENQSSWYYFRPSTGGTMTFTISPAVSSDDYDFALWGPMASRSCPPSASPLRCSYSGSSGNTGLGNGATDTSEDSFGNKWVSSVSVVTNSVYILVVDNYSETYTNYTLDFSTSGGAELNCVALPIEIETFDGYQEKDNILLNWITSTELNNDYFIIEKSLDGKNFDFLEKIKGAGNSTETNIYSCTDKKPHLGINYYRLKQVDYNGKTSSSGILDINYSNYEFKILSSYPNPTSSDINFDLILPINGNVLVEVYNNMGEILSVKEYFLQPGENSIKLDVSDLMGGVYTVKFKFNSGENVQFEKMIKTE